MAGKIADILSYTAAGLLRETTRALFLWTLHDVELCVELVLDEVVNEEGRVGEKVHLHLHLVQHPK